MQTRNAELTTALLSGVVVHLSNYVASGCPRAERQARVMLERLDALPYDPDIAASADALERLFDAAGGS
ncbi:MAG: hypothetical protein ACK4KV_19785 [Rhodocyclaceae bacterium]